MKIGVMSDSHDRYEGIQMAVEAFRERGVEMIIHCGDWVAPLTLQVFIKHAKELNVPIKSVFGNNDAEKARLYERNIALGSPVEFNLTDLLVFDAAGKTIGVYHGTDQNILDALIKSQSYDAMFTGHTHEYRNETSGKTLILNPGATCFYIGEEIVDAASAAVYDAATNTAERITLRS